MARRSAKSPNRHANRRRWLVALGACVLIVAAALIAVNWSDVLLITRFFRANALGQRFLREHPAYESDISPHPNIQTTLDVYWNDDVQNAPVLVFVHGGSWSMLSKESFASLAALLVPRGYTVVMPAYTLYPAATYDQMADEVAAAVAWTLEHAADYGGDPSRVYLSGHSAGGHLAALVLTDPLWLARYGRRPEELAGLIGLSGVYDMAVMAEYTRSISGSEELIAGVSGGWRNYRQASPITYVRPDLPSTLVIHGTEDDIVPHAIGRAFCDALQEAGSACELALYPGADHTDYLFRAIWGADPRLLRGLERFTGIQSTESR